VQCTTTYPADSQNLTLIYHDLYSNSFPVASDSALLKDVFRDDYIVNKRLYPNSLQVIAQFATEADAKVLYVVPVEPMADRFVLP
jgi:hypothetical protein